VAVAERSTIELMDVASIQLSVVACIVGLQFTMAASSKPINDVYSVYHVMMHLMLLAHTWQLAISTINKCVLNTGKA